MDLLLDKRLDSQAAVVAEPVAGGGSTG